MICASGKVCSGAQTSVRVLRRYPASVKEARWQTGAAEVIIEEALVKAAAGMAVSSNV